MFVSRPIDYPESVRKAIHKNVMAEYRKKQIQSGVPEEYAEANIPTLAAIESVGKKPFFDKLALKKGPYALPPNVQNQILEYSGVKYGQTPKRIVNTIKNIKRKQEEARLKAEREAMLREKWANVSNLYMGAMEEQKFLESENAIREMRERQAQKSRLRRGKNNRANKTKSKYALKRNIKKTRKNRK